MMKKFGRWRERDLMISSGEDKRHENEGDCCSWGNETHDGGRDEGDHPMMKRHDEGGDENES